MEISSLSYTIQPLNKFPLDQKKKKRERERKGGGLGKEKEEEKEWEEQRKQGKGRKNLEGDTHTQKNRQKTSPGG